MGAFQTGCTPAEGPGCMSNSTVLITDMAILVGIFLLGFLAKMFPRKTVIKGTRDQGTQVRTNR